MIKAAELRLPRQEGGREECGSQTQRGRPLEAGSSGEQCRRPAGSPRGGEVPGESVWTPPLASCLQPSVGTSSSKPNWGLQDRSVCVAVHLGQPVSAKGQEKEGGEWVYLFTYGRTVQHERS